MSGKAALLSASAGLVILGVVIFGNRTQDAPIGPPEIQYGQDVCSRCNMIIGDARYAAATVAATPDGQRYTHMFDDIGCAIEYEREQPGQKVLARYVTDVRSGQWLEAGRARYVRSRQIVSPMAYGVAACADASQAAELSQSVKGEVFDLAQLREHILKPPAPAPAMTEVAGHDHGHGHH